MVKHLVVVGGGLYGSLTALKLKKKFPDKEVTLIDASDKIISGFSSIKLSENNLNNGFHGIELPRCEEFVHFLSNELNLKLQKVKNERLIYFGGGACQKYEDSLQDYDEDLKAEYLTNETIDEDNVFSFLQYLSSEKIKNLEKVSKRYSENFECAAPLMMPWFLPSNFRLTSEDEGDIFRNSVRDKSITPYYAFPASGIFEEFQEVFLNALLGLGVNVRLNSPVTFNREKSCIEDKRGNSIVDLKDDKIKVFYCMTPIPILASSAKHILSELTSDKRYLANFVLKMHDENDLSEFTEILCCDAEFPEFSRVSKPLSLSTSGIIQIEAFLNETADLEKVQNKLKDFVSQLFTGCKFENASFDGKITRQLYFPPEETLLKMDAFMEDYFAKFQNVLFRNIHGPPNMSKCWAWSSENCQLLDERAV